MRNWKILIPTLTIIFVGCCYGVLTYRSTQEKVSENAQHATSTLEKNDSLAAPKYRKISFFGHQLVMNDSVREQVAAIAEQEERLEYDGRIIKVCGVEWGLNVDETFVVLFSSHDPEYSKMKLVIKWLNEIYGKPDDVDDEDELRLRWFECPDTVENPFLYPMLVQFRRVHGDKGGTFLFFLDD